MIDYLRIYPEIENLRVAPSDRPNKRFKATYSLDGEQRTVHFGLKGAVTYVDGASPSQAMAYRARHSQIRVKDGRRAIDVPGSPASLSWYLLWQ